MCFETECITTIQGHPKSLIDFGANRKHVCDFLSVINSNLGPILPHFRDIAFSAEKSDPAPILPEFSGCFPWTRLRMLWLRGVKSLS